MRKALAFCLGLMAPLMVGAVQYHVCEYGVVCRIPFSLYDYTDPTDLEETGDVAIATGDVHWYCGGTSPTEDDTTILTGDISETGTYGFELELGTTETDCDRIKIDIIDAAGGPVWFPHTIVIDTVNHASAGIPNQWADTREWLGTAATAATAGRPDVNMQALNDDADAVDNVAVVYSDTDFAANYNQTRNAWVTNTQDTVGTAFTNAAFAHVDANERTSAELADTVHTIEQLVIDTTGVQITNTTGTAVVFTGAGVGEGLKVTGGATGHAIQLTAGSGSNVAGLYIEGGGTTGNAIDLNVTSGNYIDINGTEMADGTSAAATIVDAWETQSQADPTGFHVNVLEVGGTSQTANDNGADINAILVDTADMQPRVVAVETDTDTTIPGLIATAQTDLDTITGADGTTLATSQGNYAPLLPTTAGRTLDINATGEVAPDFGAIAGTLDASEIGADAITEAKIADNAIAAEHIATSAAQEIADTLLVIELDCEVNTANFAGDTDEFACILTDRDGGAVTQATSDLTGRAACVTSGAQVRECRYVIVTTWDGVNSELQVQVDRALPDTLADAVTVEIR